jgi:hypothetical protein
MFRIHHFIQPWVSRPHPLKTGVVVKNYRLLVALMLLYGGASLLHFAHNAQFVADYPNLPPTLSAARVYAAWLVIAATGLVGYLLLRMGHQFWGLSVVGVYAILGFDGLLHYTRAPMAAHTWAMNLSIWFEVVMAAVLFALVLMRLRQRLR